MTPLPNFALCSFTYHFRKVHPIINIRFLHSLIYLKPSRKYQFLDQIYIQIQASLGFGKSKNLSNFLL